MPGIGGSSVLGSAASGGAVGGPPGALIGAGAGLAGNAISYFGSKSAQKAAERSQQQALQYQRERDAIEDRRYEDEARRRAEQDQFTRQQWQADAPRRLASASVAAKYGIQVPYNVVSGLGAGAGAAYQGLSDLVGGSPKVGGPPLASGRYRGGPFRGLQDLVDTVE